MRIRRHIGNVDVKIYASQTGGNTRETQKIIPRTNRKMDCLERNRDMENKGWRNAETEQPKQSGHYKVISKSGVHGYDDYTIEQKIWWNFDVAFWKTINEE